MGYIKKLKNNELVGGTDKTTVYPVTSAEAVFEEVSDNEFKSQKYLNNHITNERIVDNTIENQKLKDDTIDMGKLNTQLKTIIQNAYDASWKVKEEPFSLETKYDANDVVYDLDTNSSYVSLTADNQGNPVNPEDEGYVEGKWRIIINGISAVESTEVINAKVEELETEVDNKIDDAQGQLDDMIADAATELARATKAADDAAAEASAVVAEKVADAQIGYFECNTAEGTPVKATTTATIGTGTDASTYKVPAKGSIVKIKMQYATTSTTNATLQFGNLTSTEHPLYYNGEPANASNSWDAGETLSVYWDGQYYQASNAMGGGSAAGKKKLNGTQGYYVDLSGETAPEATSQGGGQYFSYIKYPVKEGDVVEIKGKSSSLTALVWGLIDSTNNNTIVERATVGADYSQEPFVKVIPSGVDFIILNNYNRECENYEWYFAKKGSAGVHEILTEPYLYDGWRTLSTGQSFQVGEVVKTADKQLLKMSKAVTMMTLTDKIAVGDFCYNGNDTYKASKAVDEYTLNPSTPYESGDYAIGSFAEYALEVTAGSSEGNITINGMDIEIAAGESAAAIASAIASNVIIDGWTLTADDNTVLVLCNTIGGNTTTISFEDTDNTGVLISGTSTPSVNGTNTVRVYDGTTWSEITIEEYVESPVWGVSSVEELIASATVPNTISSYFKVAKTLTGHPFTGISGTNQILYRDFSVKKGVKYTVSIKAVGATTMGQGNSNKLYLRNKKDEDIATSITFNSNESLINGITKTFTPTKDCDSATLWIWLSLRTWTDIELACNISWTEYVYTVEDKVKWEENADHQKQMEDIDTYPYQVSVKTIAPYAQGCYIYGEFGKNYGKSITVSGNDYRVTDYINCEGVTKMSIPLIRLNGYNGGLVFYDANKIPILDNYSHFRRGNSSGTSKHYLIDVPKEAVYFRNSMWPQYETYTFYTDATLPDVKNALNAITEEVEEIDSKINIPDGLTQYGYEGDRITVNHKFAATRASYAPGSIQGCACYGNYLFIGKANTAILRVINMVTTEVLSNAIDLGSYPISGTHANTLSFSEQFYEEGDEFPILYIPSGGSTGSNPKTFHVYGVRIQRSGSNFTGSIIKTIVLTSDTGDYIEFICAGSKAWIKCEYGSTWKWYCLSMPSLSDTQTVNLDELTPSFTTGRIASSCQGHFYCNGRIYIPAGAGNGTLYVLDTVTGRVVTTLYLGYINANEPEGFFLYNNHYHVLFSGIIYKLYFD